MTTDKITLYRRSENLQLENKLENCLDALTDLYTALEYHNKARKNYQYAGLYADIERIGNKSLFLDNSKNNFKLYESLIKEAKMVLSQYLQYVDKRTREGKLISAKAEEILRAY